MIVIQSMLLGILFLAMLLTWRRFRQHVISRAEALRWSLFWLMAAAFILWPEFASRLADLVGVGRGSDLIVYGSIVLLFVLIFNLHVSHDKLERKLTELVRREALKDLPTEQA